MGLAGVQIYTYLCKWVAVPWKRIFLRKTKTPQYFSRETILGFLKTAFLLLETLENPKAIQGEPQVTHPPGLAGKHLRPLGTEAKLGHGQQQEQQYLPGKPQEHRVKMLFLCSNNSCSFALKHLSLEMCKAIHPNQSADNRILIRASRSTAMSWAEAVLGTKSLFSGKL